MKIILHAMLLFLTVGRLHAAVIFPSNTGNQSDNVLLNFNDHPLSEVVINLGSVDFTWQPPPVNPSNYVNNFLGYSSERFTLGYIYFFKYESYAAQLTQMGSSFMLRIDSLDNDVELISLFAGDSLLHSFSASRAAQEIPDESGGSSYQYSTSSRFSQNQLLLASSEELSVMLDDRVLNKITLNANVVPEPQTSVFALISTCILLTLKRRSDS